MLDPDLWPATFIFTSSAGERCTATVIGPRVMLTAGHCIRGSDTGGIAGMPVPRHILHADTTKIARECVALIAAGSIKALTSELTPHWLSEKGNV